MQKCKDCNASLEKRGRSIRCSRCAALRRYIKKNGKSPDRLIANCEICGKEFADYESNRGRKSL